MALTQKITTYLWFNGNAEEAVAFYTSIFPDSQVMSVVRWGEGGPGHRPRDFGGCEDAVQEALRWSTGERCGRWLELGESPPLFIAAAACVAAHAPADVAARERSGGTRSP
jgi:3-demethylubiquinone-9 3-methyltransferase